MVIPGAKETSTPPPVRRGLQQTDTRLAGRIRIHRGLLLLQAQSPSALSRQLDRKLGWCAHAQLAVAGGEVRLDGLDAQKQLLRDRAVALAHGGELADLALARGQRRRPLERGVPRAQPGRDEL